MEAEGYKLTTKLLMAYYKEHEITLNIKTGSRHD